ncbi:hypothetical protein SpCBS45565_g02815 [Spizellomyces sp. 'palustris']|nr:hypothetical protein SpCBS45565_g02815 [Spizellomyces sp. 'palustris']
MLAVFTDYRHEPIYPESYHHPLNVLWFCQSLAALLQTLRTRRFLPSPKPPQNSLLTNQFRLHLITHTIFYILELVFTDMMHSFTSMAVHHAFGMLIFGWLWIEWEGMSTVVLIPFVLHAWFWVWSIGTSWILLSVYNWAFLAVGMALFANNTVYAVNYGRKMVPISWIGVPLLSIVEVGVNAFTYCWSYWGYYCPEVRPRGWREAFILVGGITAILAACVLASVLTTIRLMSGAKIKVA